MQNIQTINVDVWTDYICPYCFVHTHTLEQFRLVYGNSVRIRWHPFEAHEEHTPLPDSEPEKRLTTWHDVIYPLAFERGVEIRMPPRTARSRYAFEAACWAMDNEAFDVMHRAIFDEYFRSSADIEDIEALVRVAASHAPHLSGLKQALAARKYRSTVEGRLKFAQRVGAHGLPLTVLSRSALPSGTPHAPIALRGAAPLNHFHLAVARLFPEGFDVQVDNMRPDERDGIAYEPPDRVDDDDVQ